MLHPHGRTDRRASTHSVKNPRGRPTIIATPRPERQVNGDGYGMNHVHRLSATATLSASSTALCRQTAENAGWSWKAPNRWLALAPGHDFAL
jgi:hypothetical protein